MGEQAAAFGTEGSYTLEASNHRSRIYKTKETISETPVRIYWTAAT
jgi:hypothetical protein